MQNLTNSALEALLELLHVLLPVPNHLPKTVHKFKSFFKGWHDGIECIFYCPNCEEVLGSGNSDETMLSCSQCETSFDKVHLKKAGKFFIHVPFEKQIKSVLKSNSGDILTLPNVKEHCKVHSKCIKDISDGKRYDVTFPNLTLTLNTDGIPVFKSSRFDIWPILVLINELEPLTRIRNVILCGLWFGVGKPNMSSFLSVLVERFKYLADHGITWFNEFLGNVKSQVFVRICSCDSVARAPLQRIVQFNGAYGCSWCFMKGENVSKGKGHMRAYEGVCTTSELRTNELMLTLGKVASSSQPNLGVKGISILARMPGFDIVKGFAVDSLHCIDLGVTKALGSLWFDKCNHQEQFYIGHDRYIKAIDSAICQIQVPTNLHRYPRAISDRPHWKAPEWRAFLLFYAPVLLANILPVRFYRHFLKLSTSIHTLYGRCLSHLDIKYAELRLREFVTEYSDLYGKENCTFNVHQLLHLHESVLNWGPIWGYSTYAFEGCNGTLLQLFHGTQHIPIQITNKFIMLRGLMNCTEVLSQASKKAREFFYRQLAGFSHVQTYEKSAGVSFLGNYTNATLGATQVASLECKVGFAPNIVQQYNRAVFGGQMYSTCAYSRDFKRKDCYVCLTDGSFMKIIDLLLVKGLDVTSEAAVISGYHMEVEPISPMIKHVFIVQCTSQQKFTFIHEVDMKCVHIMNYPHPHGHCYICVMPLKRFFDS